MRALIYMYNHLLMLLYSYHSYMGSTIQSLEGGGVGWSIFEVNILRPIFHEINNCLKDMR